MVGALSTDLGGTGVGIVTAAAFLAVWTVRVFSTTNNVYKRELGFVLVGESVTERPR